MAIDWTSEPYARLFKRETDDDLVLSWEARAVWHEYLKHCDHVGAIETKRGARGLSARLRIPADVVERALPELLDDGRVRLDARGVGYVAPNYLDANFAPRSDRARAAESRLRRRGFALGTDTGPHGAGGSETSIWDGSHCASDSSAENHTADSPHCAGVESHDVTSSHTASQPVTQIRSDQIRSQSARARGGRRFSIPEDWTPRLRELELATGLGIDGEREAAEFRTYWLGDGRPKRDWDQAFAARLQAESKRLKHTKPIEPPRRLTELGDSDGDNP